MAAHEDQRESVVLLHWIAWIGSKRFAARRSRHLRFPPAAGSVSAHGVHHATGCCPKQPASRIVRSTFPGPLLHRRKQCFLNCVFGSSEIMKSPQESTEHLRREFTQKVLGRIL